MSLVLADRVQETTATTGTGTITLVGAVAAFQTFAAGVGTGNTTYYCLLSGDGTSWEVGQGTVGGTAGAYTLSRDTVLSSSNSGALISLTGTSVVFCTEPASKIGDVGLFDISGGVPLLSSFTQMNGSGYGVFNQKSGKAISIQSSTNTGICATGIYKAVPSSTPYRVASLVLCNAFYAKFESVEYGWTDGTKIHMVTFSSTESVHYIHSMSSSGVRSAVSGVSGIPQSLYGSGLWLGLRDDGTNVYFETSVDGANFRTIYSTSKSSGYLGSSGYSNTFLGVSAETTGGNVTTTVICYDENGINRSIGG